MSLQPVLAFKTTLVPSYSSIVCRFIHESQGTTVFIPSSYSNLFFQQNSSRHVALLENIRRDESSKNRTLDDIENNVVIHVCHTCAGSI